MNHLCSIPLKGLAASLCFILFLAAVVYLKVRQIESRSHDMNE